MKAQEVFNLETMKRFELISQNSIVDLQASNLHTQYNLELFYSYRVPIKHRCCRGKHFQVPGFVTFQQSDAQIQTQKTNTHTHLH